MMMGFENKGFEEEDENDLFTSKEQIDNDDPLRSSNSYANYRSVMSTLSETHHPLSPPLKTSSDPLISRSSPYLNFQNPNSSPDVAGFEIPSYADVAFDRFEDENGHGVHNQAVERTTSLNSESSSFARSPSASNSGYLKITVSHPQKEQEGSNSIVPGANTYVTYLITTRTNLPEFGSPEFSVRRRFKDVVSLADRLSKSYKGLFVPPRPDKSVVESQVMQKQEFVEQRRVALEKYLKRLAAHPVIKFSSEFKAFLKAPIGTSSSTSTYVDLYSNKLFDDDDDSSRVVASQEAVAVKEGRGVLRLFQELKQSMSNDWGLGSKPLVVDEDKEFLENKEKLLELEKQLTNLTQKAECVVRSQEDMGSTMGELGLALMKLSKFENQEAVCIPQRVRAADMKNAATSTVKASRFYRELTAQTVKHLDCLHEYLGLMLAVHGAFADRSSALLTVQTLLSELASLNMRAEKLEMASSKKFGESRSRKVEELKESIRVTEDAKNLAMKDYERIKENNMIEIERLDKERQTDFINMLKGFVTSQVGYAEKMSNVWTKVAEDTSRFA